MNNFKAILSEICAEEGIHCEILSHGYIHRLTKDGTIRHIVGPYFDLNPASADRIACDKYACSVLLLTNNIPAIPHELIFNPLCRAHWIPESGAWRQALEYFHEHGEKIVVKPNKGKQGLGVYVCETPAELERAIHAVFEKEPDVSLSPFYEIEHEYRIFYVLGECPYAYGKKKAPGSWKHNLSQGAEAFEIEDAVLLSALKTLARQAAHCINIHFCTVDIARLQDKSLRVMEINAGVAVKILLEQRPEHRDLIKSIYARAVKGMFNQQGYTPPVPAPRWPPY